MKSTTNSTCITAATDRPKSKADPMRPRPSLLSLNRCIETGDVRLSRCSPGGQAESLAPSPSNGISQPAALNQVELTVSASFGSLREGVAMSHWGKHSGVLFSLLGRLAQHEAIKFVSECLAYNLLSGGWARGLRDQATKISIDAKFPYDCKQSGLRVDDARAWPSWAVATPAQAAAGMPDPMAARTEFTAPLAAVIRAGLAGEARPAFVVIRGVFTLDAGATCCSPQSGSRDGPAHYFLSAENIRNALRTFDRFHGDSSCDRVLPIEPDAGRHRSPQQSFLPLLMRAMDNLEDLSPEELYYLIGVLVRGGIINCRR